MNNCKFLIRRHTKHSVQSVSDLVVRPHLQLLDGDKVAVVADEVGSAEVHHEAGLEAGHVVALGALVQPHVQVNGVDVVAELVINKEQICFTCYVNST